MSKTRGLLFVVEDGVLTLNREEIRAYPAFKKIIDRDRGQYREFGDTDGRKKKRTFKEFMYIFSMCDYESPIDGLLEKDKHLKAVEYAKLEEGYKPDKEIREAMNLYIEIQDLSTPIARLISSVKTNIATLDKVVKMAHAKSEKALALLTAQLETNPDVVLSIDAILSDVDKIINIANALPKTLDTLDALEQRLAIQRGGAQVVRGGVKKSNREDPEYVKRFVEAENIEEE